MLLYEICNSIPYFFTSTCVLWLHELICCLHDENMMYLFAKVCFFLSNIITNVPLMWANRSLN